MADRGRARPAAGGLLGEDDLPAARLVRADDGVLIESESGLRGRMILADGRTHRTEVLEAVLAPGADYRARAHGPGTEELVVCLGGSLTVGPRGEEQLLGARDALRFPGDVAHRYASEEGATALVVMSYPTAGADGRRSRDRRRRS